MATQAWPCHPTIRNRFAFTLLELVVVLGIIAFLAVVTLPAVSRMMEDSRLTETENKIKGLLRSARSRAMDNKEAGLFFFVQDGVQKAVFIAAEQNGVGMTQQTTADRFRVLEGNVFAFPPPYRVVPRGVLDREDRPGNQVGPFYWSNLELASDDYRDMVQEDGNRPQNHRNFFTILFTAEGHLLTREIVLIHDGDEETDGASDAAPGTSGEVPGTVTGLPVATVAVYQDAAGDQFLDFNPPPPSGISLSAMLTSGEPQKAALNFPSVDGLLVYDDSVFRDYLEIPDGPTLLRQYLIESAAPYYVSRQSGMVIAGPKGEIGSQS